MTGFNNLNHCQNEFILTPDFCLLLKLFCEKGQAKIGVKMAWWKNDVPREIMSDVVGVRIGIECGSEHHAM